MVDCIIDVSSTSCSTCLTIEPDNLLMEDNQFSEAGLLEHVAQSVAAWHGAFDKENSKPKIGVIGSIRNCNIMRLPKIGETIMTTISVIAKFGNKQVVHSKTYSDNYLLAETDLSIAIIE